MDRIERNVRSVNPVPELPEVELPPALLRDLMDRENHMSTDDQHADTATEPQKTGIGWVPKAAGVLAAAVVVAGAVFVSGQFQREAAPPAGPMSESAPAGTPEGSADPTDSAEPTDPAKPTDSVEPTGEPDATGSTEETGADWSTYTTPSGLMAFDLPPAWTVEAADFYPAEEVLAVRNADGQLMATLAHGVPPTGHACGPEQWPYTILDSEPVDLPSAQQGAGAIDPVFSYRVLESSPMVASYGLTDVTGSPTGENCVLGNYIQDPGELGTYFFANHLFVAPPVEDQDIPGYRVLTFDSVEEAAAYTETREYRDIKRMITSLQLQ
ncbi:hypothetical protein BJ994_002165 [Arthrobacter pigmenti]|uniref:Uncharacterized protein n=2 Tax=Arthrobacter pigmenti TaxID=271432 RepID=A0A846RPT0_9MICC|nr:hypothetical protein [Arthrobacter pigmenti]